jgi:hypothetical protein
MIRFSKTSEDERSTNKNPIQSSVSCPVITCSAHDLASCLIHQCLIHQQTKKTRKPEWKEKKLIRDEFRSRLNDREYAYKVIKRISDTNILDDLKEKFIKRKSEGFSESNSSTLISKEIEYKFDNMIFKLILVNVQKASFFTKVNSPKTLYNSLSNSVIYDFDCSDFLTWDKRRFVDDIIIIKFILVVTSSSDDSCERVYRYLSREKPLRKRKTPRF